MRVCVHLIQRKDTGQREKIKPGYSIRNYHPGIFKDRHSIFEIQARTLSIQFSLYASW